MLESTPGAGEPPRRIFEVSVKARREDEVVVRARQEAVARYPGTKPEDWVLKSIRVES